MFQRELKIEEKFHFVVLEQVDNVRILQCDLSKSPR